MQNMKDIYFVVMQIVSLVFGIIFCITIVGAIFGIPLIIASGKFKNASTMNDYQLAQNRGSLLGWGIFVSIMLSPTIIGLILALICTFLVDNYIKNIQEGNYAKNDKPFSQAVKEGANNTVNGIKNAFSSTSELDKKATQLKKLEKMREDDLITQEEYQELRRKILGL